MLTEFSATSTDNLEGSSVGALKTASIKPWGLVLSSQPRFETFAGTPYFTLRWRRESAQGDLHHFFAYRVTDPADLTATTPLYPRLFAHLLLDDLPSEALTEVLEHLADAWAFYQHPQPLAPSQPQHRTFKGKVIRRYERPAYTLSEEE